MMTKRFWGFTKTVRPTLVVADDNEHCLSQVCGLLEKAFDIVGHASNGIACVEAVRRHLPAAVVLDVSMPGINGIEAARRITELCPSVKVIMLSVYEDSVFIDAALAAGAAAYVAKLRAFDELIPAVHRVLSGAVHTRIPKAVSF
jgi:DNA-binding NarL/FixJ family response regulator